jgi:protein SCO1
MFRCSPLLTPSARLIFLIALLSLSGCGPEGFKNTDITGSDFARTFSLTDHTGAKRTLADYQGKVVAVFFGFTQCPDFCPTALSEMKAVKEALGEDGEKFQVLFITVDPERDTPALLAQYAPKFDPSFVGLSGDVAEIERTAKEYKVYYRKVPGSKSGSYTMDHSVATYLYDPEGRVRLYVRQGTDQQAIVHDVKQLLRGA